MLLSISCSPLGSLRSLFANAHVPANAGMMFNGCAVVCCGSFGSSGMHKEPGSVAASTVPSWEPGHRSPGVHQRHPPRVHSLATDEQRMNRRGTGENRRHRAQYSAKIWHTRPQEARHGLFIVAAIILPTRDAKNARGAQNRPFPCYWHGCGTDTGKLRDE